MSDGDVVHQWVSLDGVELCAIRHGDGFLRVDSPVLMQDTLDCKPNFDVTAFTRRDAEQLLVAFDKMEGKV